MTASKETNSARRDEGQRMFLELAVAARRGDERALADLIELAAIGCRSIAAMWTSRRYKNLITRIAKSRHDFPVLRTALGASDFAARDMAALPLRPFFLQNLLRDPNDEMAHRLLQMVQHFERTRLSYRQATDLDAKIHALPSLTPASSGRWASLAVHWFAQSAPDKKISNDAVLRRFALPTAQRELQKAKRRRLHRLRKRYSGLSDAKDVEFEFGAVAATRWLDQDKKIHHMPLGEAHFRSGLQIAMKKRLDGGLRTQTPED